MHANLLIFDTATEYCSVALLTGGQTFSYDEHCKNQHAAKLLGIIDKLLAQAKINLQDLDAISFGCGPGSFTGVRIAISVAQGLAYGLHKPVIPISTLQIMAQTAYQQQGIKRAHIALDARMQQIYCGVYALDENALMQPCGELELLFGNVEDYINVMPVASAALPLALSLFSQGKAIAPELAQPIYLRDDVAHKKQT
ncbi:MAG: tRNA (adenosine(37)-N6)-threonylcarbamoyltransferase complex dimerization subunit type 1 TsaB [Legionellales bacterium]|jgi:tRNA threonylcarbamoyladenosine biosynthesis protein TsaB